MERAGELILRSLAAGPRTVWDLVCEQNTQHRRFTRALGELCQRALVRSDARGTLTLTETGWQAARERRLTGWGDRTCPTCQGRSIVPGEDLRLLQRDFERAVSGRPATTTEFDQGVVPAHVAMARLSLLEQRGDLAGKDILLLGDDDLTSLALALQGLARRITVLEIDSRLTAFLRRVSRERGWAEVVDVVDYDVRTPLPERLHGQFDVFFTDPVETVTGIRLFLSRCCQALRSEGGVGYFGLTHIESGWSKWLEIERAAIAMNFAIAEVLKDFNAYQFQGEGVLRSEMKIVRDSPVPLPPPERLWFQSTLFRLQAVGMLRPLITGSVDLGRELYADEDTI